MLKDMGFKTKRTSQNKSLISPSGLRATFMNNLLRYGTKEQIEAFRAGLTVKREQSVNHDVNLDIQTDKKVNRLTESGGY